MNWRDYLRPVLAGLVGLGIVVVVIVLIVKLFTGHGAPSTQIDIGQYANTPATVTLLADGPTNVDQDHRQIKITVSQTQNEIDIIQGYEGNVMSSNTYPSNSVAFGTFLQSLKLLNFAQGNNDKSLSDYRGYCPTGDRYVFTFNDGQTDRFTYWTTSCGGQGTYKGNRDATLDLFRQQIPQTDYGNLTQNVENIEI